jgi:biopolymer transport protein TolR
LTNFREGNKYRKSHRLNSRLKSEINITPLVDVMLVLLIVFMIAAPLLSVGVPVNLPKTEAKSLSSQKDPLTVTIDSNGKVFIQEKEIAFDQLATKLNAISENGYKEKIYIRGDRSADYGKILKVMARINTAGFENIGLVTDPINQ